MRTAHNIGLSVRYDTPGDVSRRRSKRKKGYSVEGWSPFPAYVYAAQSIGLRFQHRTPFPAQDSGPAQGLRFQHRTPVQPQKGRPQIEAAARGKTAIITVGSLGKLRLPTVKTTGPRVIMAESLESTARRVINGRKRRETDRAAGS